MANINHTLHDAAVPPPMTKTRTRVGLLVRLQIFLMPSPAGKVFLT